MITTIIAITYSIGYIITAIIYRRTLEEDQAQRIEEMLMVFVVSLVWPITLLVFITNQISKLGMKTKQ